MMSIDSYSQLAGFCLGFFNGGGGGGGGGGEYCVGKILPTST